MGKQHSIKHQFGFKKVADGEKQPLVSGVFSSVAGNYDIMNDAMSLGIHRLWKHAMIDQMLLKPDQTLLDVASGTGDIVRLAKAKEPSLNIISTDVNADMLGAGRRQQFDKYGLVKHQKSEASRPSEPSASTASSHVRAAGERGDIIYSIADGSKLPFNSATADRISIAFGIRNIPDIEAALAEFYRVLKPGGKFVCLEFSKPATSWLEQLYDAYSFNVIPWLGEVIGKDREAYQYLVESIRTFPTQDQFKSMINAAGFARTSYTNLSGGIVAIHSGVKI